MKRKGILVAGLLFVWATAGYSQVKSGAYRLMLKTLLQHSVPEISVPEAAKKASSTIFLDAREPREYEVSHLKGALYAGYDHFDLSKISLPDENARIVVYCSVGYRSEKIAEKLIAAGYKNVANLYGGIFEWVNQGNPIVDMNGNATNRLHTYNKAWSKWVEPGKAKKTW